MGYIGKLADDIDRSKMKIIINQFINPSIFQPAHENELGIKGLRFHNLDLTKIDEIIEEIHENDASIFGLHHSVKPISEYPATILSKIRRVYK